jgi:hypothetical protein
MASFFAISITYVIYSCIYLKRALFLEDSLAILTFNLENVMNFVKNNYFWEEDAVTVFDCHSLFVLL